MTDIEEIKKLLKEEKKVELVIINMSNSFIDIYSDKWVEQGIFVEITLPSNGIVEKNGKLLATGEQDSKQHYTITKFLLSYSK